jgi:hypothetical protein
MIEQHARNQPPATPHALSWPEEAALVDWIAAWQPAREDVVRLLAAYAELDGGHDVSSFTPLIDELDAAMRLLHYRVDWLRSYLSNSARLDPRRD